jgi:cytochrome c5
MPLPLSAIAYGSVVVAGVVLFSVGTPGRHSGRTPAAAAAAALAKTGTAASSPSSVAAGGITLHSVSLELPASDRTFPGGAAADAINNNCLSCHSAGMVLTQPAMSRAAWQAKVDSMLHNYKAPVAEAEVPAIVDYLANLKPAEEPR